LNFEYDVLEIAQEQEDAMDEICEFLKEKPIKGVKVLIHNGSFMKYGKTWTHSMFSELYNKKIESNLMKCILPSGKYKYLGKHELVHFIMGSYYGFCQNKLFLEGFTNAIDGIFQGRRIEDACITLKKANKTNTLGQLWDNSNEIEEVSFYPQSGIFIKWLIQEYGIEKSKKLYGMGIREEYPKEKMQEILGISFEDLSKRYENQI
jgi:hypothetical protein